MTVTISDLTTTEQAVLVSIAIATQVEARPKSSARQADKALSYAIEAGLIPADAHIESEAWEQAVEYAASQEA